MDLHTKLTILNSNLNQSEREKVANILEILGTANESAANVLKVVSDIFIDLRLEVSHKQYTKNKENYEKKRKQKILRGEEFKKKLKVGMLIKLEGTNDRSGLRLIERLEKNVIVGRKVSVRQLQKKATEFIIADIFTSNGYDKVVNIVSENPKIKSNRVIF